MLAAAVVAAASASPAAAQSGPGWRVNATRDHAFVMTQGSPYALDVSCYEGEYIATFGVMEDGDVRSNFTRADRGVVGLTSAELQTLDAGGGVTANVRLTRWRQDGAEGWSASLTTSQLRAVRSAARLRLRTSGWSVTYTGTGSSRAIGAVECLSG
ncbi:hypothetical protein [Brevundimonas sp.]|jgi:hypothetical protein|uniref:hypothetical protein n=1 Tax=Brevundimonas sp. TaxID=1871086 RepID=UPI002E161E29|nr:hypothetical protein [Brevundimonas sp.]